MKARLPLLILLYILTVVSCGFCQTQKFYEEGLNAFEAKEYKKAIFNLEFAFGAEPDNTAIKDNLVAAYQAYAGQLAENKDWEEAIKYEKKSYNLYPDNSDTRIRLSNYYNNYAVEFSNNHQFDKAKENLLLALSYNPQSSTLEKNLSTILTNQASSLHKDGQSQQAIDTLFEALRHNLNNSDAYFVLGRIYYDQNKFEEAGKFWKTCLKLKPTKKGIKENIEKALKDAKIEKDFKKFETENFIISFDDKKERDLGFDIKPILADAYRNVGWHFDHYPKNKISVVIYTRQQFMDVMQQQDWVLGVYEGRIRLPLSEVEINENLRRNIIYHEYAHALINDLFPGKIPIWLHEGIAQTQEPFGELDKLQSRLLKDALKHNKLIPLEQLESYISQPAQTAEFVLANLEAGLFIEYLLYRYSYYMLKEVLKEVSSGKDFATATQQILYLPIDRLWENFVQHLKEKYL